MEGFFYFCRMNKLYLILFCFLLIPFVPKLGSVDVIGPQWLLFSCFNLFFLIYNFFTYQKIIFNLKSSVVFKNYVLFFLLLALSVFYSVNVNLTIHDLARDINVFLLLFNLLVFLKNDKINFYKLSLILSLILFFEVLFSMKVFINDFLKDGFKVFQYSAIHQNAFLGITGNKNITAASIVLKLPFLFYLLFRSRKWLITVLGVILYFAISFDLSVLSARASLLSFVFITLCFYVFLLYSKKYFKFSFLVISMALGIYTSIIFIPSDSNNPINRLSSIEVSNESSSFRLELWNDAFSYLKDKLFYGSGRGSWKIESAQFWSEHGKEYLVPYHAHNDFLEIGTELGWLGMISYLSVFFLSFLILLKSFFFKGQQFSFFIFLALSTYFVDAFFNFPMERPIMQITFAVLLFLITYFELNKNQSIDE